MRDKIGNKLRTIVLCSVAACFGCCDPAYAWEAHTVKRISLGHDELTCTQDDDCVQYYTACEICLCGEVAYVNRESLAELRQAKREWCSPQGELVCRENCDAYRDVGKCIDGYCRTFRLNAKESDPPPPPPPLPKDTKIR